MKENHQNFGFIGFGCEPSDQNRSVFCEVLSEQTGLLEPFIRFNSLIMLMLLSENKHWSERFWVRTGGKAEQDVSEHLGSGRVGSAAGPPRLLVVDGEVVEQSVRRAGVARRGPGSGSRPAVAMVTTADSQVPGQLDLHLEQNLPVLQEKKRDSDSVHLYTKPVLILLEEIFVSGSLRGSAEVLLRFWTRLKLNSVQNRSLVSELKETQEPRRVIRGRTQQNRNLIGPIRRISSWLFNQHQLAVLFVLLDLKRPGYHWKNNCKCF